MPHIYENLSSIEERPFILILTFWVLLVRYVPLDVVMLRETGEIIYSKFI